MRTANLSLMAMAFQTASAWYVWPNKYDDLEDMLVIQSGYLRFGFTDRKFSQTGPHPYKQTLY